MGVFVKLAADTPVLDKVIFRNLVSLVIALSIVLLNRRPFIGKHRNQLALMGRSLFGIGGVVCFFWAIDHLLLADATIIFSALFGWLWWVEVPDLLSIAGGLLIIAGGVVAFAPTPTRPATDDMS